MNGAGLKPEEEQVLKEHLALPAGGLGAGAKTRRAEAIEEAKLWPRGPSQEARVFTPIYCWGGFSIGVQKPGKEAAPREGKKLNPNDMLPTVQKAGQNSAWTDDMGDIFGALETLRNIDTAALEIVGSLIFRSAFMLDHKMVPAVGHRLEFSPEVVLPLTERVSEIGGKPPQVFLYLLEMLALNEDVKYNTLGYGLGKGIGRPCNLLTCAHFVAVLLGKKPISPFAGALLRTRVAPLSQQDGRAAFRFL